jgi:excisionase family DNA binding protein
VTTTVAGDVWPTCQQVAEARQTSVRTIYRRVADGTLEARRIGPRLIRINPESVASWGAPAAEREAS